LESGKVLPTLEEEGILEQQLPPKLLLRKLERSFQASKKSLSSAKLLNLCWGL